MTEKACQFNFKNNVGNMMQLQFSPGNANERYYVKLLGYLPGKSIIATMPHDQEQFVRVPEGQFFIVRLLSGVSAQVFTAHAIAVTTFPYPHIHLSFPDKLESKSVRRVERVDCKIIATVQNEEADGSLEEGKSSLITNISTAGALLHSVEPLGKEGDRITLSSKIEVADLKEQYLHIPAVIRRIYEVEDATKLGYGLEFTFDESSQMEKLLLYSFVYEQMIRSGH